MNSISVSPSLPLRIPSPPTCWAEKGHAGAFQTFSLWRWGGNGLAVRQNPHSFSLTTPEKDRVCHPAICNQYPRLHWQEAMENEGAMGLAHRYCFRVTAVPTLATKRSYNSQDHFGRSLVFEGKKTREKGGRQVARGALVVGMRNADHCQCT